MTSLHGNFIGKEIETQCKKVPLIYWISRVSGIFLFFSCLMSREATMEELGHVVLRDVGVVLYLDGTKGSDD